MVKRMDQGQGPKRGGGLMIGGSIGTARDIDKNGSQQPGVVRTQEGKK